MPFPTRPRAWLAALLLLVGPPVAAHEGHDHDAPVAAAPARPRVAVHSDLYEVVAVREAPDRLRIWLDLFDGNVPVTAARIEVTIGDVPVVAEPEAEGTFRVASPVLAQPGMPLDLVFSITNGPVGDDLLAGTLPALPPPDPHAGPFEDPWHEAVEWAAHRPWLVAAGGALLGLVAGVTLARPRRRAHRRRAVVATALTLAFLPVPGRAGPGHDHDEAHAPAASAAVDAPSRLPDGTVFLPKVSQRLLEVRTAILREAEASRTVTLVGRVVADPNRGGLAQSLAGGRIVPPENGLPRLGQAVRRDEVLAIVEPPIPVADQTTIAERSGDLEQQIAAAEARLARARNLAASGAGTRVQVVDTEIELEGLRRRRVLLSRSRVAPEVIRAPADGIIASARAVAGQVVAAQDVLFQIVDPAALWVEALVFGADAGLDLRSASASVRGGQPMRLEIQGFGRAVQQGATLAQFRIVDPPTGLALGQPVTVVAQVADPIRGLILPRAAVVRAANGEQVVWRHVEPESFTAAPVRIEPLDAARVLVAAGLRAGERVVVQGAGLVNQVR
ncbi:efflux RND transporter periplasmic adaptor subunit [Sabulicella rubraurantiaca]|uniref:efflux RND transporter periplasmic adaptor subunit n=1 Tax=Sabulicella rubraurantiaca TaxID=2811429 RepID=UPI001A95FB48|nr:HlyD family efflux transporter periplasmic adaptor subunit [Sabulicella rubraurantiaca]